MCFKIDWASLIVGSKFTVFALFYFVFEGSFPKYKPPGAYNWRGDLTEGFLRYEFGGLIFGILRYVLREILSSFFNYCTRYLRLGCLLMRTVRCIGHCGPKDMKCEPAPVIRHPVNTANLFWVRVLTVLTGFRCFKIDCCSGSLSVFTDCTSRRAN